MSLGSSKALNDLQISVIRQMNQKKTADTIDLGLGQLLFSAPQSLRQAGADSFLTDNLGYGPTAGIPKLRQAIADDFNEQQKTDARHENVIITNGAEHALYSLIQAMINPGDEILIPEIGYPAYPGISKLFGAKIIEYKLDEGFGIDSDDLSSKLSSRTKIVIINSPSNPTGAVASQELLKQISSKVARQNPEILILSDEVYSSLNYYTKPISSIAKYYKNTAVISSVSKQAAGAGVRIGWLIAPEAIIEQVTKIVQYSVTSAALPNQKAVLSYLGSPRSSSAINDRLKENRQIVIETLSGTSLETTIPQGAFYYFADISKHGKSQQVADSLLDNQNLLVIPGIAFGKAGDKYMRISFGVEVEVLKSGLKNIIETLG